MLSPAHTPETSGPDLADFLPQQPLGGCAPAPAGLPSLVGMNRAGMQTALIDLGLEPFRVKQVWHWIYARGATSFDVMSTLSKPVRAQLAEHFTLGRPAIAVGQHSSDGTRKWLLRLADNNEIETVFIPETDRGTLCISSQVGCTLTCRFCHTGTQMWVRNLTPGDIVGQLMLARDELGEWSGLPEGRQISNIVLMGMGEPLYNFENVKQAMLIALDNEGLAFSRRRITLSTSGVVPMIERCGAELGVNLAISLHAPRDEVRDVIMPINKKYPLAELLRACRDYPGISNARRITFEYVMLKGINDSDADARELVRILGDIPAKVNLIPFNPWPGTSYECSSNNRIRAFADIVEAAHLPCPIRKTRGQDILAACGQLKSESKKVRKSQVMEYTHRT
jgi:23S rRNA (adenine2503-C2)-methyltransferase